MIVMKWLNARIFKDIGSATVWLVTKVTVTTGLAETLTSVRKRKRARKTQSA